MQRLPGLLDSPELVAFFRNYYFGLGAHNGSNYRTHEALGHGRLTIITQFQKVVETLIEQRASEHFRLQDSLLETEGLSRNVEQRLRLACKRVERDIVVLKAQIESAAEGKGWVLDALNLYQTGFQKGVKESVHFELLANIQGGTHQ